MKVIFIVGALFASTFVIAKVTGFMSIEQVKSWFYMVQQLSPLWIVLLVIGLQFLDLFIAVPNLTVAILSGYFLGFQWGSLSSMIGMFLAGVVGYLISHKVGPSALKLMLKNENQRLELENIFRKNGFVMILLSRALPILPEVTACLAGFTKMNFAKFFLAWSLNTIPYAVIAAYAGSISSLENPQPAILVAIGISGVLWSCWFFFSRKVN